MVDNRRPLFQLTHIRSFSEVDQWQEFSESFQSFRQSQELTERRQWEAADAVSDVRPRARKDVWDTLYAANQSQRESSLSIPHLKAWASPSSSAAPVQHTIQKGGPNGKTTTRRSSEHILPKEGTEEITIFPCDWFENGPPPRRNKIPTLALPSARRRASGFLTPYNVSRPPTPVSSSPAGSFKRPSLSGVSDLQVPRDFSPFHDNPNSTELQNLFFHSNKRSSTAHASETAAVVIPTKKNRKVDEATAKIAPSMKFGTPLSVRYKRFYHSVTRNAKARPRNLERQPLKPLFTTTRPSIPTKDATVNVKKVPDAARIPSRPTTQRVTAVLPTIPLKPALVAAPKQTLIERVRIAQKSLDALKLSGQDDGPVITPLIEYFKEVTSMKSTYQNLLHYKEADAQLLLNTLQILLDHPLLTNAADKKNFLHALLHLSKKSGLYPECLVLKDISREEYAFAAGHFSEVFKGTFHGRSVALKVVRVYQCSDIAKVLKVFHRESIIWSQLSHQNLLPFYGIYYFHPEERRLCFVSPWMKNGNLREYLSKKPNDDNVLFLLSDILSGIEHLHSMGIVHSDLKGDNVLVAPSGRACLADFGLSNLIDSEALSWTSLRSTTQGGGTTRWQAPELHDPSADYRAATKESDIYSFAGICYEALTGKVPFYEHPRDATVLLKMMEGHRPSKPDKPALLPSRWPIMEELWSIMEECWHREPVFRPTATQLLQRPLFASLAAKDERPPNHWTGFSASQFRNAMHTLVS